MILVIILDAPFSANVKVSNWNVSTSKDQLEVGHLSFPITTWQLVQMVVQLGNL